MYRFRGREPLTPGIYAVELGTMAEVALCGSPTVESS